MTRLLIVGPPGAGKGTQAARISANFGIPAIATGDIFRQNINDKTELGLEVKAIVDAGDYVPDELTNALVASRLDEGDAANGFLLDGYPRTAAQVAFLGELLREKGESIDAVIQLVVNTDEVITRLKARATEQGRADDSEEAVRHRQELYSRETTPLIALYRERGLLVEVDALGEVDTVSERIEAALAPRGIVPPAQ